MLSVISSTNKKQLKKNQSIIFQKLALIISLGGLLFISAGQSFADSLSLDSFLSQVKTNHPLIQSSKLRSKAMEKRIEPAGAYDDPFVAAGVDEVPFHKGKGHVRKYQVSQSIPFPGKLSTKSAMAENRAISAHYDAKTSKREIIVLATQAFYRAYYTEKNIELNEKLRQLIQTSIDSAKGHYETGDPNHHDILIGKIELSILDVERLRLLRELKTFHATLNEFRNKLATTPINKLAVSFSHDELQKTDIPPIQDQPELKSLESVVKQAEKEKKLAQLAIFPDFVVQGMAMQPAAGMMDQTSNWGVMVGINIPIFFQSKQIPLKEAACIDKEAAVLEKNRLKNRLDTEAEDARKQFGSARDVVSLYKKEVLPTTELAVKSVETEYIARKMPLRQYLDTLKVQRMQELEFIAAQIDVELARLRLKEPLSSPPILRLAPVKPSLFGTGAMEGSMNTMSNMGSATVNMGGDMSGPTRKPKTSPGASGSGSSGMGMGAGM